MRLKTFLKTAALAGVTAAAAPKVKKNLESPAGKRLLYDAADTAINGLLSGVNAVLPDTKRPDIFDFDPTCAFGGTDVFLSAPAPNAKWSLGYARASILPPDIRNDAYFLGGYLAFPPNIANGVLDDQMIRCIALSDGSGRGIAVFAVIDCVGISNHDVNDIRERLAAFAAEHGIVSLNVSATHAHSCIDTMGVWGDLTAALKTNPVKVVKDETDYVSGRNEAFMENLKETAASLIRQATENMKPGALYRGTQDGGRFLRDKRPPEVMMTDVASLVFRPDDGSAQTRAVFMAAHPTQFGADNRIISADFPYYLCEEIEKTGDNALFFQGAQLAIATERGNGNTPDSLNRFESVQAYGRALGKFCLEAPLTAVPPVLNVTHRKILAPVSNRIFALLAKLHVINNDVVTVDGSDLFLVSEIGYAQLGDDVCVAMIPGELAPEIVIGGCRDAAESYDGNDWTHKPLTETAGGDLLVIGLCNDEIAYIIPDNDFGSLIAPLHYEESVSAGKHTASKLVGEFEAMLRAIKWDNA